MWVYNSLPNLIKKWDLKGVAVHHDTCIHHAANKLKIISPLNALFCVRLFTYLREIYVTELNAIFLSPILNCAIFGLSKKIYSNKTVSEIIYLIMHTRLHFWRWNSLHLSGDCMRHHWCRDPQVFSLPLIAKKLSKYI